MKEVDKSNSGNEPTSCQSDLTEKRIRQVRTALILSLFFISLGGFLLHVRIHPFWSQAPHGTEGQPPLPPFTTGEFFAFVLGLVDVIVVTALFCGKKTVSYGYLLNGMFVIIGTITMAHFSIVHLPQNWTIIDLILKSTLADILLLFCDFTVGKAIYDSYFGRSEFSFRYLKMGWWLVHFIGIGVVYTLGAFLWP